MKTLFEVMDVAALLVLWWTSFAALHGGHTPRDWRDVLLTFALIAMSVFAFCGAAVVWVAPSPLPWWTRGVLHTAAVISAWLYDYRFGIARHVRMARGWFIDLFHRRGHA
jgi:hypothetical protein